MKELSKRKISIVNWTLEELKEELKMLKNLQDNSNTSIYMKPVSNTSPLIALKHAKLIEKLEILFSKIIIPPALMKELSIKEENYFKQLNFLEIENPINRQLVAALKTRSR